MFPILSERLERNWFFRYKLYHFLFWAVYHLVVGATEFSFSDMIYMIFHTPRYLLYLFYVVLHTLAGFVVLYLLVPRLLERGRLMLFIVSLTLWSVLTSFAIMVSMFFTSFITGKGLDYFCAFDLGTDAIGLIRGVATQILPHTAGAMLVGLSIKLVKKWSQTQQKQQELEKEKLETELKFLRYQFNPHFLFNTINSIFFLIHKDPSQASDALGKFSDLLRYQLYDCNEAQIPLSNEIGYLKNFVALEKHRKPEDLNVYLDIPDFHTGHLGIAPFILMTFVENAFKHVSKHKDHPNWIQILLRIEDEQRLIFEVSNSISEIAEHSKEVIHYGGIGLKNVQRRLTLVYPERHHLDVIHQVDHFMIRLSLRLEELQNPVSSMYQQEVLAKI